MARRRAYATWMGSPDWRARRRAWLEAFVARHGAEPRCAACGGPWSLEHGDLHHRTDDRLGAEADSDLLPLCRPCHDALHRVVESNPAWAKLGRAHATDVIVGRLRRRTTREEHHER